MEGRRRQKWDNNNNNNNRRSQSKRPPRGRSWQPTVPKWEKEFCQVVGSLDWETLLQMKKFTHLYENVINWDDSAGEEAFSNAKNRFWATINGLSCHLSLPDPDQYIDKIEWDSEIDTELVETEPMINNADENHDPVVIFGDSLFPNQTYSLAGWGDDDENFKVPDNINITSPNYGDAWEEKQDNLVDHRVAIGWPDYNFNNSSGVGDGSEPTGYNGWNNDCDWNYAKNDTIYQVGNDIERNIADGETCWGKKPDKRPDAREWSSFNSCGPVSHHAAITVGQTWNH